MDNHKQLEAKMPLIGVAIAGAIAVTTSGGQFDMIDTIVGIILLFLLRPFLFEPKSEYLRWLVSLITGLSSLLVVGVTIEVWGVVICPNSKYQMLHFLFWVVASFISLAVISIFEKKT